VRKELSETITGLNIEFRSQLERRSQIAIHLLASFAHFTLN
jgi:hypothetical protein